MIVHSAGIAVSRLQHASLRVRAVAAFVLGAAGTLAMPPWTIWPVLWVVLPGFLLLLETALTKRMAFFLGWAFGFGYFSTGFAWIGNAFFVDRETFAVLAVPAIGGLAVGFGLYIGVVALALRAIPPLTSDALPRACLVHQTCRIVLLATVWSGVEWWRGWFLTGLPWNPIGSTWVAVLPIMQSASVVGVYGLSLITVLAAGSVLLLRHRSEQRIAILSVMACHLPLVIFGTWGAVRIITEVNGDVPGILLRLVQPNIPQVDKWRPALRQRHLNDQVAMSIENASAVTHVLWSETAAPFPLNRAQQALTRVAAAVPENGFLLTGAPRIEGAGEDRRAFNSLFVITPQATIAAVYDKTHLVPFGEYMPLQDLLPVTQLTGGSGFTPGPSPLTIALPGLPAFSPLICYEVIFPGAVTPVNSRPEWLFNLTNDAWFGLSSGPYQHLAAAQLRAVEEGLPVVRVANTGISAVIDGYGQITARLGLGRKGFVDSPLPLALPAPLFSRIGNMIFFIVAATMTGTALVMGRKTLD